MMSEHHDMYRKLLLALCRDLLSADERLKGMHDELHQEKFRSRRFGIQNHINCNNRHRTRLLQLLSLNRKALVHFFGTSNPKEVVNRIKLQPKV